MKKSKAKAKTNNSKTIGLLIAATDTSAVWQSYITAFQSAVSKSTTTPVSYDQQPLGGAGGDPQKYAKAAKQLVSDKVDVIVTAGELAAAACKKATKTIPIVVASAGDLAAVAAPNLTGFTNGQVDPQILDARIRRMNNKWNPIFVMVAGNDSVPPVKTAMDYVLGKLGKNKGYKISLKNDADVTNLQSTLASHKKPNGVNVLYVCSDPFLRTNGNAIVDAAHAEGVKTMHEFAEWHTKHGGDLCYGLDFTKLFEKAAGYVVQILGRGVRVTKLPVIAAKPKDCVETP